MADLALQMPAWEPIWKLITFIFSAILFAAHLLVQPNYGNNMTAFYESNPLVRHRSLKLSYHIFPALVE
jgi:hypothetical protein